MGRKYLKFSSHLASQIPDNNKLVGQVKGNQIKDTIYDFFGDEEASTAKIHYFSITPVMEYLTLMETFI